MENRKKISGSQKFWCTIFGIAYIIPTFIICWLFEDDTNEKRKALCNSMLQGAKFGLFMFFLSLIVSLIKVLFFD